MMDSYRPFWNRTNLIAYEEYCHQLMDSADSLEQGARARETFEA